MQEHIMVGISIWTRQSDSQLWLSCRGGVILDLGPLFSVTYSMDQPYKPPTHYSTTVCLESMIIYGCKCHTFLFTFYNLDPS